MKVKITELKKLASKILKKHNYSPSEIKIILEILFYAQLRGNNQGLIKLIGNTLVKNSSAKPFKIIKETKLSILINGNQLPAMVVMESAMNSVIKKALAHGFGIAGTNNTSSSTGAIGYYANKIAKQGLIGFVFAGSPPTVATYGSYEPIFGTNPLAIGLPSTKDPIVLDMATAAMAYYGIVEAKTAGRSIPPNIAYDKDGNITTDPTKALAGAIMTFDRSYKSTRLALIAEILTGPLVNASFSGIGDQNNWGNLIFAIDPELLVNKKDLQRNIALIVKKVKESKKLPGVKEIYTPGERGNNLVKQQITKGEIIIEDNLFKLLHEEAEN